MRIRKNELLENERTQQLAKTSDALAHPARVSIFRYILKENMERRPVRNKDIVEVFPYSQATISQHMNKLVQGNLVEAKQEGTSTLYYANVGELEQYINLLRSFD